MRTFGKFHNFYRGLISSALLALLVLVLSCSKSTDPDQDKPPDDGPMGVLLSGADTDPALTGTRDHGPFAVPEAEWSGDLATTRIQAMLNPAATVGQVNSILSAVGAKLSCMRPNMIFTELIISPLGDSAAANTICSTLTTSGAFSVAFPCFRPVEVNERPPQPAGLITGNLEMQGITAAWNARDHLQNNAQSVLVLVSDQFYARAPHTQIAALSFPAGAGSPSTDVAEDGFAIGNHGFMVSGTIGANNDALGATGVFPTQTHLLRIHGIPIGGFASWTALLYDLADVFPASGDFVLNSSYGYGGDFLLFPRERRILDALFWRSLVAEKQSRFLHAQAAGNKGFFSPTQENADWNSPFSLASRFDTPTQMLQGNPTTVAWAAQLQSTYETLATSRPAVATKLTNVLVVGSSNSSGELADFSSGPSDLRMVSETHPVPCAVADNKCSPDASNLIMGLVDGTSFAAPQVAGLAAYLMAIDNSLTIPEIKQILMANYNSKWVDAYNAVLSLDRSLATASIRVTLLDISNAASSTGNSGPFNEEDIKVFLDSLKEYQTNRLSETPPYSTDYSRCDLNGNGYAGDSALPNPYMPFDLDVNTPPAYSSIDFKTCPQVDLPDTALNELQMTDLAILKYYAYSPLYSGDPHIRDSLFGCMILFTFPNDLEGWSTGIASTGLFNNVVWVNEDGGYVKLDGSDGGSSDGQPNSWMFRLIDIPAGSTILRFYTSPHARAGVNGALRVRLHDGTEFHTLLDWEVLTGIEGELVWTSRQANISAFAGQTVTIYFEQGDNDIGVGEQRYIDNVSIR